MPDGFENMPFKYSQSISDEFDESYFKIPPLDFHINEQACLIVKEGVMSKSF